MYTGTRELEFQYLRVRSVDTYLPVSRVYEQRRVCVVNVWVHVYTGFGAGLEVEGKSQGRSYKRLKRVHGSSPPFTDVSRPGPLLETHPPSGPTRQRSGIVGGQGRGYIEGTVGRRPDRVLCTGVGSEVLRPLQESSDPTVHRRRAPRLHRGVSEGLFTTSSESKGQVRKWGGNGSSRET